MRTALILLIVALDKCNTVSAEQPCRLYLGPSSLSTEGVPKLGLYAGVGYEKDDLVGIPEINVPLIDFSESWNRETELSERVMDFLEGYLWTAEYSGSQFEGNYSVTSLVPGTGILANYHPGTHNIEWLQGSVLLREQENIFESAVSHPSRGAISDYNNLTMRASRPIKQGEELFANLGDFWDSKNQTEDDIYGDKLTRWDYIEADKILDKVLEFMVKYEDKLTPKLKDDILDLILSKVLGAAAGNHAKVIRSLIPAHPGKLQMVKDLGGTFAYRNSDLVKTQKWLDKHAVCVDNLEAKPSTIPEAGRGAFATRDIEKGGVVAPVPTLHIVDKEVFEMFDIKKEKDENAETSLLYDRTKPRGQQLILNYCFSHPESSMLFFPVSPMVNQINHAPPEKANARLTWSKNKQWGNAFDLQDMTPLEISEYNHISIVLEVYALRDIEQGEEVFIDYGPLWEKAWDDHMRNYQESDWPLKADDLKKEYKEKPFKTREEVDLESYPSGIQTACFVETEEMTDGRRKLNDDDVDIALFSGPASFEEYRGSQLCFCEVIDRKESGEFFYNYTVASTSDTFITEVIDIPHAALTFVDLPYTSDIHEEKAFRHPIGIPDVIFPQAWRDKRG